MADTLAEHPDEAATVIPCAWFFLPLGDGLGLPDGLALRFPVPSSTAPGEVGIASVCIRRVEVPAKEILRPTLSLFSIAAAQFEKGSAEAVPAGDPPELEREMTVVVAEVGVSLAGGCSMSKAFDVAVAQVRRVQHAYAGILQRPVKLLARQHLPMGIPVITGSCAPGRMPMFESMTLFLPSVTGIHALVPHPVLPSEALDVLRVALNVLVPGGAPFATYSELRNESWVQLHHEGNLRLAGLATGVCGEVFLDTVLLHLLWEEGATPEEAARVFERNRHKARVLAQYHEKLGGCWSEKGDGPIASYLQRVVNLRNRIAHGGHEPSAGDVESAQDAMMSLESFVADRVLENVTRYPLTAFSLFGIDGLRSRGRYSRKTEAAIQSRAPLDWEGAFARWRYHFARVRGNGVDPGVTPESLNLVWARYPDGSARWFVHDRDARMASAVDAKAMVPEEVVRTLDELRVALENENPPHPIYTDVRVEPTRLAEAAGDWVPEYELIPELSIRVPG